MYSTIYETADILSEVQSCSRMPEVLSALLSDYNMDFTLREDIRRHNAVDKIIGSWCSIIFYLNANPTYKWKSIIRNILKPLV